MRAAWSLATAIAASQYKNAMRLRPKTGLAASFKKLTLTERFGQDIFA
jgi:hypothetical protein